MAVRWYGLESSERPSWQIPLQRLCSVGAKLIFISLIIAGLTYFVMLVLILAGDD